MDLPSLLELRAAPALAHAVDDVTAIAAVDSAG